MKKHSLFCLAVVFLVLTGCDHDAFGGSSGGGSIGLGISQNQLAENPTRLAGSQITFEQALQIALARTSGGTLKEIELERKKNGVLLYDIEILTNGRKVEMYIDAMTGQVTNIKEKRSSSSQMNNDSFHNQITSANAARLSEIGLARLGCGTIEEMGWKLGWNSYIFEIEIRDTNGRKHEVKIDSTTSTIISIKSKR